MVSSLSPFDLTRLGLDVVDLTLGGTKNPARTRQPIGVVVHSPGVTYISKVAAALGATPLDEVRLDQAIALDFDGRDYQPGYLIGQAGGVYVLERDDRKTSHAGMLSYQSYQANWREFARPLGGPGWLKHGREPHVVYDWWDEVMGRDASPLSLPCGRHPNQCIGIDLVPSHRDGSFSDVQIGSLAKLIWLLSQVHGFELDRRHVLTHSFAAPLERGTVLRDGRIIGVHWDPPAKHYDHVALLAGLEARK